MKFVHADRDATPVFSLANAPCPVLSVSVTNTRDTVTNERLPSLAVSTVRLTYFPGKDVARRWLAAAWAGYQIHESLELVTADGMRPIDPHAHERHDRGLRHGLPITLTPETLLQTFEAIAPPDVAREYAHAG
jgi:hypothetical protein